LKPKKPRRTTDHGDLYANKSGSFQKPDAKKGTATKSPPRKTVPNPAEKSEAYSTKETPS